jgi:hypothetical protein
MQGVAAKNGLGVDASSDARTARLEKDRARLALREIPQKPSPREPMPFADTSLLFQDRDLERRLRDVDRNCRILRGGYSDMGDQNPTRLWHDDADQVVGRVHSVSVNLPVRPVTAIALGASAAPARPAGYAGRHADLVRALRCIL